ncbi:DJ-1/PfpI family protein [Coraliomargarita sp. SDUM461003]|uniref:DJ-1/PfpI family protein n=1 Tax=Thalassobacterium maritimum TaxID=3041265 RepID=A0ABU1AWW2_9BACT|nr:DJ-1 family glyoxalase III [Coraliomargarita sp. SDUM461003]MDQ8208630.1 DJ-1/PfpI family protein [Coraliomargarita sp. SDUM461003]
MKKRALILLHPGFEEMEAVAPIDLLARAEIEVVQASTSNATLVTGRNGITMQATHRLADVAADEFDAVILPGGPGILQLRKNPQIIECLQRNHQRGKLIACICAAPLLLLDAEISPNIAYTAHPSTLNELPEARQQSVVRDGSVITSRGAGTATEFALSIVRALRDENCAQEIAESICWPHSF